MLQLRSRRLDDDSFLFSRCGQVGGTGKKKEAAEKKTSNSDDIKSGGGCR